MTTVSSQDIRSVVMDVLATIPDPEMPISIVDLGLVEDIRVHDSRSADDADASAEVGADDGARVAIDILPTFVGCPALPVIQKDIETKVAALPEIATVEVRFIHSPAWSVDRISATGREQLREIGVTVPQSGGSEAFHEAAAGSMASGSVEIRTSAVPCPFCGSAETRLESMFGPTRCKMIYYCDACRNTFEHLKRV